jgi:hypothetical protein
MSSPPESPRKRPARSLKDWLSLFVDSRHVLVLLGSLIIAPFAEAQIGCTLPQCKAHYGEPSNLEYGPTGLVVKCDFIQPNAEKLGRDYHIFTEFDHGICDSILYSQKSSPPITTSQANILLRLNSNGYIWTRTGSTPKGEIDYSAHIDGKVVMLACCAAWKWLWIETPEAARDRE